MKKRIIVGASGASGMPLLKECLKLIREAPDYESWLIMTDSAKLTLSLETEDGLEDTEALAGLCTSFRRDRSRSGQRQLPYRRNAGGAMQYEDSCRNPQRLYG